MTFLNISLIENLIMRYQEGIFALVVHLIGGNKDRAYDITAECFTEHIRKNTYLKGEEHFWVGLITTAIEKSRAVAVMPTADSADYQERNAEKRKSLHMVRTALYAVAFNSKVLLLLRDQMHLTFKSIANVLHMSEKDVKIQVPQARIQLRDKIEEVLRRAR